MLYFETNTVDVYKNFAYELYLAETKNPGDSILMIWQSTPTLMLGRYQNIYEEINLPFAKKNKLKLVRRLSGGGCIFTDQGSFQFSIIKADRDGRIDFTPFVEPVLKTLESMGLPVEKGGRNDLLIGGKKFSGNAQYQIPGKVVHHGSILFDTNLDAMNEAITPDSYKIKSKGIASVRERVTNLLPHFSKPINAMTFKEKLKEGLCPEGKEIFLSETELTEVMDIAEKRFKSKASWIGKNPKFTIERSGQFPGGKISFKISVKAGKIEFIEISGDFFAPYDFEKELKNQLEGISFTLPEITCALSKIPALPMGMDAKNLAELIIPVSY